jgi:hypothetical protein
MKTRIGTLAVLTTALACAPAQAATTTVTVRVEGATKTIFEGKVGTSVHEVTGDSTGPHKCDGTNGGAHPTPAPTATGAFDDASKKAGFDWSGSFSDSFEDFQVNTIGPDTATSSKFWGYFVNGKSPEVGGCGYQVAKGDEVLWAYDAFNAKHILRLDGPSTTRVGKAVNVKVTDGKDGSRVEGVSVGGKKTNSKGIAKLRFKHRGTQRLKASRKDSIRSNQLRIKVLARKK